jgi:hypothetical protein
MLTFTLEVTQKYVIRPSNECSMCVMTLSNHLCKKDMGYAKRRKENKYMLKIMRKKKEKKERKKR